MKKVGKYDYHSWKNMYAGFGMPPQYDLDVAKRTRRPLEEKYEVMRYKHMKNLYDGGAPYSWIAKLYEIDRAQVYRIINKLPNKTRKSLI